MLTIARDSKTQNFVYTDNENIPIYIQNGIYEVSHNRNLHNEILYDQNNGIIDSNSDQLVSDEMPSIFLNYTSWRANDQINKNDAITLNGDK